MPTSNLALWPTILHLVWEAKPRRVLDVGPGWGKAGVLLREYAGVKEIDAVEAWPPYVTPQLRAIYDQVHVIDVRDMPADVLADYDLVLMVEVLEHLSKPDGLALLERIPGRVVICTPAVFFQNPEHKAIPPETHRSVWSSADFGARLEREDVAAATGAGAVLVRLGPKGATT